MGIINFFKRIKIALSACTDMKCTVHLEALNMRAYGSYNTCTKVFTFQGGNETFQFKTTGEFLAALR